MEADITKALLTLHDLLLQINSPWYVVGTSSLLLSGYDVKPNDIDILTDTSTASAMAQLLDAYKAPVQLKANEKFSSAFSRYIIDGASVEVMGDLQVNTADGWINVLPLINHPQRVSIVGTIFSVPSATEQVQIYTLFNRDKDKPVLAMLMRK